MSKTQWVTLANDIRIEDGNHDLGAGELAERLVERGWRKSGDSLDAAWAEAEAALPEGMDLELCARTNGLGDEWRYVAGIHDGGQGAAIVNGVLATGHGPTPVAALRALAAALTPKE